MDDSLQESPSRALVFTAQRLAAPQPDWPLSPSEAFMLLGSIQASVKAAGNPIIHITSAYPREGVTSVCVALARAAVTRVRNRPILVVHDRRPRSSAWGVSLPRAALMNPERAGLASASGFDGVTVDPRGIQVAVLQSAISGVGSRRDRVTVFDRLRSRYDMIVIDSPAVLENPAALELARAADATLLVVEAERTRAPVACHAKQLVENCGGKVAGAILNKRQHHIPAWLYHWL